MPKTWRCSLGSQSISSSVIHSIFILEGRQCFRQCSDLHLIFPFVQSMSGLCSTSYDIGSYSARPQGPSSHISNDSNFMSLTCFPIHTPMDLVLWVPPSICWPLAATIFIFCLLASPGMPCFLIKFWDISGPVQPLPSSSRAGTFLVFPFTFHSRVV